MQNKLNCHTYAYCAERAKEIVSKACFVATAPQFSQCVILIYAYRIHHIFDKSLVNCGDDFAQLSHPIHVRTRQLLAQLKGTSCTEKKRELVCVPYQNTATFLSNKHIHTCYNLRVIHIFTLYFRKSSVVRFCLNFRPYCQVRRDRNH